MRTRISTAGNDGFTLLELIVVLVIVGLTVAVVSFSVSRLHEQTLFNQDSRKLYNTLKKAREIAVLQRQDVTVHVDEESGSYGIDRAGGQGIKGQFSRGTEIRGKDIVFYPKGNSSGGVITLRNAKGREYSIEVDRMLGSTKVRRL